MANLDLCHRLWLLYTSTMPDNICAQILVCLWHQLVCWCIIPGIWVECLQHLEYEVATPPKKKTQNHREAPKKHPKKIWRIWISMDILLLMPRCINKFRLANDTIAILVKLLKGCNHITGRHGSQWYRIELPVGRPFEVQVCNEIKYVQNGRSTFCSISGVFMNKV